MELNFIPTLNNLSNLECLVIAENEIKNLKFKIFKRKFKVKYKIV